MLRKIFATLVAFVALATTAWAQTSQSVSRTMTLTITPFLACSGLQDMDWGSHRRPDGPLFSSATSYLSWQCDTDVGASVNFSRASGYFLCSVWYSISTVSR